MSHGELNLLTFGQGLEAGALDGAEMCEHIRTTFLLDKTKTFSFVEPLTVPFTVDIILILKIMIFRR